MLREVLSCAQLLVFINPFFISTGCGYDIMVANNEGYEGQYHIDGTSNDRTTWAKASDDTKAVWWDKKNKVWCAGPRVSRGKQCTSEMYTGKKAPPTSGASADNSATVNINCPHDGQLRWYKGEQQTGNFRITNVSWYIYIYSHIIRQFILLLIFQMIFGYTLT